MNSGAITKRYATALLRFTLETGSGERVCRQVVAMLHDPSGVPADMEPDLQKFLQLLFANGRADYLRRIFRTYVDLYCEAAGLKHAVLTSAVESEDFAGRIRSELESRTGRPVLLETATDPSLIGGYRLELDGLMLDASVRRQIEILQRQFIEKNNRIV